MSRPLDNVRHERFAQAVAGGMNQTDAVIAAGYKNIHRAAAAGNASRIRAFPDVEARIQELMRESAQLVQVEVSDVLRELTRIAFFDPRTIMRWVDAQTEIYEANPDDLSDEETAAVEKEVKAGKVERLPTGRYRKTVSVPPGVWIKNSDEIGPEAAAAIASVEHMPSGLRVKFHNKVPALEMLGKYLGLWSEDTANAGKPFAITDKPLTAAEWLKMFGDKEPTSTQH